MKLKGLAGTANSEQHQELGHRIVCKGKKRYSTLQFANNDANAAVLLYNNPNMKSYYCNLCKGYHLTTETKR